MKTGLKKFKNTNVKFYSNAIKKIYKTKKAEWIKIKIRSALSEWPYKYEQKVFDCKAFLLQNLQKWRECFLKILDFIGDFEKFN